MFCLFCFEERLFGSDARFFLPQSGVGLPPGIDVVFGVYVQGCDTYERPFFALKANRVVYVRLANGRFGPYVRKEEAGPLPFGFRFGVGVTAGVVRMVGTVPLPMEGNVGRLLHNCFPLPYLSFCGRVHDLPRVNEVSFGAHLGRHVIFDVGVWFTAVGEFFCSFVLSGKGRVGRAVICRHRVAKNVEMRVALVIERRGVQRILSGVRLRADVGSHACLNCRYVPFLAVSCTARLW